MKPFLTCGGPGGYRRRIFIDGLLQHVTQKLEITLRHLRHVSQSRVSWIDAICINRMPLRTPKSK